MNKKNVLNFISMIFGLMIIFYSPMIGNNVELHSIYEDITRSYFTYIAYTISFSILGLAIFLLGAIGYYMNKKIS